MHQNPLFLGLAAVIGLASANPRPAPAHSVAGETGCGAYGIYCDTPSTFSVCVPNASGTQYFFFGSVAQGTYCDTEENRIRADNYGNCSPDGQIFCGADGTTFFVCDQGGLINFGPTAAGTECVDGHIVACNGPCGYDNSVPTTTLAATTITPSTIFDTFTPFATSSSTSSSSSSSSSSSTLSSTSSSTSSSTLPSTTTVIGYYATPADGNLLDGPVFTDPNMTTDLCGSDCQGYPYFALENGDQCNCGTTAPSGTASATPPAKVKRQAASNGCTACAGNSFECCGAPGYALVYEVTPSGQTPTVVYSTASSTDSVTTALSTSIAVTTVPSSDFSSTTSSSSLSIVIPTVVTISTSSSTTSPSSISTSSSTTSPSSITTQTVITVSTSSSTTSRSSSSPSSSSSTDDSSSSSSSSSSSTSVTVVTSTSTSTATSAATS